MLQPFMPSLLKTVWSYFRAHSDIKKILFSNIYFPFFRMLTESFKELCDNSTIRLRLSRFRIVIAALESSICDLDG